MMYNQSFLIRAVPLKTNPFAAAFLRSQNEALEEIYTLLEAQ